MTKEMLQLLPSSRCMESIVQNEHPELYRDYKIIELQRSYRPEGNYRTRRTRIYDYCWFSEKPQYIRHTVEDVFKMNPDYILWCYKNLYIQWSEHAIKMFKTNPNFKLKTHL